MFLTSPDRVVSCTPYLASYEYDYEYCCTAAAVWYPLALGSEQSTKRACSSKRQSSKLGVRHSVAVYTSLWHQAPGTRRCSICDDLW